MIRRSLASLALALAGVAADAAAATNLVANPSLELADPASGSRPAGWRTGSPGTQAATFTWATDAFSGSRSGRVDVTSYTSGDAKWYFDPVAVTTSATYVYRDWYRATRGTKVVAAWTLASGATSYQTLGTPAASAGWSTAAFVLTPPATARALSVYHLIAGVGSLQIDDAQLLPVEAPDLSSGVPNGSLEQQDPLSATGAPLAWSTGRFGTSQATFQHDAPGRTGARSVAVTVSGWTSGDAKWFFAPQPVTPGAQYFYADWYQADAESFLLVRLTLGDGSFRYVSRTAAPAAAGWSRAHVLFTAPPDAVAATVFHGLARDGTLRLDDASLQVLPPVAVTDGVPNAGLEEEAWPGSGLPAAWTPNAWGDHDATFTWAAGGHSGARGVRVDVSRHATGTASWSFDAQPATPGATYAYSDWYRSDVETSVQVQVTAADGAVTWITLPKAFVAPDWTRYSATFVAPGAAAELAVFHYVDRPGALELDDAALVTTTTRPFRRGLVSVVFDDGFDTDHAVLPLLDARGAVATHYVITGELDATGRLSTAMLGELLAHGHEIGSHTVDHADLTTLSPAELDRELVGSRAALAALGIAAPSFASPLGAYSEATLREIASVYASHRSTDTGYNTRGDLDLRRLKVQKVKATTAAAEVNGWAAQAAADRSWLIVVYHSVADPARGPYGTTPADLDAHLAAIAAHGLPFVTVEQALAEIGPQVAADR